MENLNAQLQALERRVAKTAQGASNCFDYQHLALEDPGTEEDESLINESGHYDGSSSAPSRGLTPSPRNDSTETAIHGHHHGGPE